MDGKEVTFMGNVVQLVPIIAIFIAMFWIMNASQRKEKKKKEELLKSLKKGLKVQTVGGIIGQIEEISNDDEITLIVDTRNKGTLTVTKDSIASATE